MRRDLVDLFERPLRARRWNGSARRNPIHVQYTHSAWTVKDNIEESWSLGLDQLPSSYPLPYPVRAKLEPPPAIRGSCGFAGGTTASNTLCGNASSNPSVYGPHNGRCRLHGGGYHYGGVEYHGQITRPQKEIDYERWLDEQDRQVTRALESRQELRDLQRKQQQEREQRTGVLVEKRRLEHHEQWMQWAAELRMMYETRPVIAAVVELQLRRSRR